MIQWLIKLGKWLETRFPKKLVITEAAYTELSNTIHRLHEEVGMLRNDVKTQNLNTVALIDRIATIEASAVHKGAVKDLVSAVQTLKDDYVSFKASMGFNRKPEAVTELQAMLNGEMI